MYTKVGSIGVGISRALIQGHVGFEQFLDLCTLVYLPFLRSGLQLPKIPSMPFERQLGFLIKGINHCTVV